MDKIEIQSNIFVQIKQKNTDLTILPISIKYDFLLILKDGPKWTFGPT